MNWFCRNHLAQIQFNALFLSELREWRSRSVSGQIYSRLIRSLFPCGFACIRQSTRWTINTWNAARSVVVCFVLLHTQTECLLDFERFVNHFIRFLFATWMLSENFHIWIDDDRHNAQWHSALLVHELEWNVIPLATAIKLIRSILFGYCFGYRIDIQMTY